ncbi:MAG: thiamine biosynthesis lipoprotein [Thermoleophilia bacterium]|nr:thiamine biosynthesis lipoprotein [Thermoleophilia bacterium]
MLVLRHAEPVMGTVVSFDVRVPAGSEGKGRAAIRQACEVLHDADATFSTWKPASPISRLRRGEVGLGELPGEVHEVLDLCTRAHRLSAGWFDAWAQPGGVDPTGLVKGWAVARAAERLRDLGITVACVNGGGDIAVLGEPEPGRPWTVGIRDPEATDRLLAAAQVRAAIATSGTYERGSHVIDPRTGTEATSSVAGATVVGPQLAIADALATALVAAGPELLAGVLAAGYEALTVGSDGALQATPAFPFQLEPIEPVTR